MTFSLLNVRIWDDTAQAFVLRDLHIEYSGGYRHRHIQMAEGRGETLHIDLNGAMVLPGLINAHDHLAMNHFPRTAFRDVYPNAHLWGEEVNARLDTEPYKSLRTAPLADKVFIGGLKNLLSGVTMVVHHDAPHKPLFASDFPVRVLENYGWAHTIHFMTHQQVVRSYQDTPQEASWFIHLAEGTDAVAQAEYDTLKEWGCISHNTVLIHGVGLTDANIADGARRIRALVVCPSTNRYLLKADPPIEQWQAAGGTILYGSDSRLTADGDLLTELQHFSLEQIPHQIRLTAQTLKLPRAGYIGQGSLPDFVILDGMARAQVRLVVCRGIPMIGDPDLMQKFRTTTVAAQVDGVAKRINAGLARRIRACSLKENGLDIDPSYIQRWFFRR